jgi:hypothetical protein
MVIKNNNGTFSVNAAQFNYLMSKFEFNLINWDIVHKTNFINSTWEYSKADEYFEKNWRQFRNQLK